MKKPPAGLILIPWLSTLGQASAGVAVITPTGIARARIDALSFFVFTYLVIAWVVKLV